MLYSALECKMKKGSGRIGKRTLHRHGLACSSVVFGLRVSNGLNGCECKYRASLKGRAAVVEYLTDMTDCSG